MPPVKVVTDTTNVVRASASDRHRPVEYTATSIRRTPRVARVHAFTRWYRISPSPPTGLGWPGASPGANGGGVAAGARAGDSDGCPQRSGTLHISVITASRWGLAGPILLGALLSTLSRIPLRWRPVDPSPTCGLCREQRATADGSPLAGGTRTRARRPSGLALHTPAHSASPSAPLPARRTRPHHVARRQRVRQSQIDRNSDPRRSCY